MTLADRVVVMNDGRIDQIGTPSEVYHRPKSKFVAGFIGSPAINFIPCRLVEDGGVLSARVADGLAFPVPDRRSERYRPHLGREVILGLRPEHIGEAGPGAKPGSVDFTASIDVVEPMGMETVVSFTLEGHEMCARLGEEAAVAPGRPAALSADMNHMHLIDPDSEMVL